MFYLGNHPEARGRALEAVRNAPDGMVVTVRPPTRSLEMNAALHALLTEISERCEWAGQRQDVETWKRLFTGAWSRATGQSTTYLPALDGNGIEIVFRRTSSLTKDECSELLDYISAWAAEHMTEETGLGRNRSNDER